MNREGAGVFIILAGIIVIIGAARGTWRQLWKDVTGSDIPNPVSGANISPGGPTIQNIPVIGGIIAGTPTGRAIQEGQSIGVIPRNFQPTESVGGIMLEPLILPYTPGPGQTGQGVVATQ